MTVPYMQAITERYKAIGYTPYRWFQAEDAPAWTPPAKRLAVADTAELSTSGSPSLTAPVDDLPGGRWIGCVVPKRHARRAVTRNLLKRQIRASFERHAAQLPGGLWLVRLRAGFPVAQFVSARSTALAQAARAELDGLLAQAA